MTGGNWSARRVRIVTAVSEDWATFSSVRIDTMCRKEIQMLAYTEDRQRARTRNVLSISPPYSRYQYLQSLVWPYAVRRVSGDNEAVGFLRSGEAMKKPQTLPHTDTLLGY